MIPVFYVEKSLGGYIYATIPTCHLLRMQRHLRRASMHFLVGRLDYALGSYRKADRAWQQYLKVIQWGRL